MLVILVQEYQDIRQIQAIHNILQHGMADHWAESPFVSLMYFENSPPAGVALDFATNWLFHSPLLSSRASIQVCKSNLVRSKSPVLIAWNHCW